MTRPCISVVLPVYNEHANIAECLRRIATALAGAEHEILVCYDFDEDSTLAAIAAMPDKPASVRLVKNTLGRGAPKALRAGFAAAEGDVIVTTMADLSDPPELIPRMAELVRAGADVVSGSRYMAGGSQTGGPLLKRCMSQTASFLLRWVAGLRTLDATNNFRAYRPEYLRTIEVQSQKGFEIALELTVKAHLSGASVSEIPSSWTDRSAGKSNFKLWKWLPHYLRWFVRAMLAPLLTALAFVVAFTPAWWHAKSIEAGREKSELSVLGLAAIALVAVWCARALRGRTTRYDILQPVVWLFPWQFVSVSRGGWILTACASLASIVFSVGPRRFGERVFGPNGLLRRALRQENIGWFLVLGLMWIARVITPGQITSTGLDLSWSRALGIALRDGMHFGSGLCFTYGPLGYFATGMYEPSLLFTKLYLWETAFRLVATGFLVLAARRMSGPLDKTLFVLLIVLLPLEFDAWCIVVIAAVTLRLCAKPASGPALTFLGLLVLALLSLVKFTSFTVSAPCVLAIAVWQGITFSRARAVGIVGIFGTTLLALWFACGQTLLDLPIWILRSAQIAGGYSEGESTEGGWRQAPLTLVVLVITALLSWMHFRASPKSRARWAWLCVIGVTSFFAFKTGYVRAQDHLPFFFGYAAIAVFMIPAPVALGGFARGSASALRCTAAACAVWGMFWVEGVGPYVGHASVSHAADVITRNALDLLSPEKEMRARTRPGVESSRATCDLPKVRAVVGHERIDMVSQQQGALFLNELNWAPRPVFQGYVTFSTALQRVNADYFESERAPRFVLFVLETIDARLPTQDEALALQSIARLYEPNVYELGYLLMERRKNPPADVRTTVLAKEIELGKQVQFDQDGVQMPAVGVLALDVRYTLLGRLTYFLYRAPPIFVQIKGEDNLDFSARIVPGMVRGGFIASPVLRTQDDWVAFVTGAHVPRMTALTVVVPPDWAWMYSKSIGLRLESAPALMHTSNVETRKNLHADVFERNYDALQTPLPHERRQVDGQDVLLVHAPSDMRFDLQAGDRGAAFKFGFLPEAWEKAWTDGASFSVYVEQEGKPNNLLFRKLLEPLHTPEDRGMKEGKVAFQCTGPCKLHFITRPGPAGNTACDWCYWSQVTIE